MGVLSLAVAVGSVVAGRTTVEPRPLLFGFTFRVSPAADAPAVGESGQDFGLGIVLGEQVCDETALRLGVGVAGFGLLIIDLGAGAGEERVREAPVARGAVDVGHVSSGKIQPLTFRPP